MRPERFELPTFWFVERYSGSNLLIPRHTPHTSESGNSVKKRLLSTYLSTWSSEASARLRLVDTPSKIRLSQFVNNLELSPITRYSIGYQRCGDTSGCSVTTRFFTTFSGNQEGNARTWGLRRGNNMWVDHTHRPEGGITHERPCPRFGPCASNPSRNVLHAEYSGNTRRVALPQPVGTTNVRPFPTGRPGHFRLRVTKGTTTKPRLSKAVFRVTDQRIKHNNFTALVSTFPEGFLFDRRPYS